MCGDCNILTRFPVGPIFPSSPGSPSMPGSPISPCNERKQRERGIREEKTKGECSMDRKQMVVVHVLYVPSVL